MPKLTEITYARPELQPFMCGCLLSVHYFQPEPFRKLSGNVPRYVENKFVRARTDFQYAGDWTVWRFF